LEDSSTFLPTDVVKKKRADLGGAFSDCSSQQAVVAEEIGLRARCAGGRSHYREPSLQCIWVMWTATGSSTQIRSLRVSFLNCLSLWTEVLCGLG